MIEFYGLLIFISFSFVEPINLQKREFSIEGKVEVNNDVYEGWKQETKIMINGGEFIGHLRENGTFVINGLETGVYDVIAATNQWQDFYPYKVRVSPDGKVCAWKIVSFTQERKQGCEHYPFVIRRTPRPNDVKNRPFIFDADSHMLLQLGGLLLLVMLIMWQVILMTPIEAQEEMKVGEENERRQRRAPILNRQPMTPFVDVMEYMPEISAWLTNFFSRWVPLDPPKKQTQNRSREVTPTSPLGRKHKRQRKRRKT